MDPTFSLKICTPVLFFDAFAGSFLSNTETSPSLFKTPPSCFTEISMETNRLNPEPQSRSSSSSSGRRRRSSSDFCNSPEFEFWMVRNPCFPEPNLLSADELFVDGVLLPLRLLSLQPKSDPPDQTLRPDPPVSEPDPGPGPELSSTTTVLSASKRWRDIFKKSEKKSTEVNSLEEKEREKGKKKERKSGGGGGGSSSAELNINIWPFSRSRSAGNAGTRPRLFPGAPGTRRVNSAPCSRSNSAGESKSRKWPSSPGRTGVHLGRSSPVWQVRRSKNLDLNSENGIKSETSTSRRSKVTSSASTSTACSGGAKARVLSLNVPMCIGYKQPLSCRGDENSAVRAGGSTNGAARIRGSNSGGNGGAGNAVGSGGNLFNLRSIFTKKSVVTSH